MASITRIPSRKEWRFQVWSSPDTNGKRHKITRQPFRTKTEARVAAARFEAEQSRHGFTSLERVTFRDVYENWYSTYKNTVRQATANDVTNKYKPILKVLGNQILNKITPQFCQKIIDNWYESDVASYKKRAERMSRIFKYAIKMDILHENPMDKVVIPADRSKLRHTMTENYYTRPELQTFLDAVHVHSSPLHYTVLYLLAFTGMRCGEALALNWNDINFDESTLTIDETVTKDENNRPVLGPPKNNTSYRTITLDSETLNVLNEWKQTHGNGELLFTGSRSGKLMYPNMVDTWMTQIVTKFNKIDENKDNPMRRITTHGLRHTFATLAQEAGINAKAVQEQLGHSSITTTLDIYTANTVQVKAQTAINFATYLNTPSHDDDTK